MRSKADRSVLLASGAVLAVGLAGTWLVVSRSGTKPRPPGNDLVEILVVRQDLPVLTLLDESVVQSHIGRGHVRRDRLPAGAVSDERLVLGKCVNRTLRAGVCLTDADVGHLFRCFSGIDDYRAYYVQLDPDDRVEDALRPGDRVDLFVSVRVCGGRIAPAQVLKGVLVLAVNTAEESDRALSVAVTPAQADTIRAAEYRRNIRAVRSARTE